MLDRQVINEFLKDKLNDWGVSLPNNIDMVELTQSFCLFVEDDYHEWLEENSKSFFLVNSDGVDWNIIRSRMDNI